MGSLETGFPSKRNNYYSNNNGFSGQRSRSRFTRLVFFKRVDYLQLICGVATLFFFVFLFQVFFLPGEDGNNNNKSGNKINDLVGGNGGAVFDELLFLKELDFGEDLKFEPLRISEKFRKNGDLSKMVARFGYRKPKIALVFADLVVDQHQILMVTLATALLEIGYEIEVFAPENGPTQATWREIGVPISVIATSDENINCSVDWLNYDGILVNSLKSVGFLSCLMQEPFKNIPLVWTIHEHTLASRLRTYVSSGQSELVDTWKRFFSRATVIVFPNYILPIEYSICDPGNYFVIPGSPEEAWKADKQLALPNNNNLRSELDFGQDDFVIAVVGSQLSYKGVWLEHAFVLQALYPILTHFEDSSSRLRIIVLGGDSTGNYSTTVETIALKLGYPNETVKRATIDRNTNTLINTADLVIYGSFLDEHSFPDILLKAMSLEKPIVAPDLPGIRKYVRIFS
ncbi:PREDICTED: uncharacterized protein LOC105966971, partial [Erythranthe guttata]|uniref:uncharacterized protein LOC105966971 n=1 Tax=Erythranthe guttata TaxID=4155 RepID=UPI00064D92D7